MMRVLIYADPPRLYDTFLPSLRVMRDHLFEFCGKALLASGRVEIKAVVSEIAKRQADEAGGIGGIDLLEMPYVNLLELHPGCRSLQTMQLDFFLHGAEDEPSRRLSEWLLPRLHGWEPDVVLSFPAQAAPFARIFPKALCLTMENGIFSRFPFPRTLRFEPIDFANGFLNRYRDRIWNFPIDESARAAVGRFRKELTDLLAGECPFRAQLEEARQRFCHLVLCPVPAFDTYGSAAKDDQFLWLMNILNRVPREIGLIVTFHDNVQSQLNERTLEFLKARYSNLLYFKRAGRVTSSVMFYPFVDAILNYETMTGTQGMLVCPRVVQLDEAYSSWMSDSVGLEGLSATLARAAPDRTALIYWYFTHFMVCERHFSDPEWYFNFFNRKVDDYRRNGVRFELFEKCADFEENSSFVLKSVRSAYEKLNEIKNEEYKARHCIYGKIANRLDKWSTWFREKAKNSCH